MIEQFRTGVSDSHDIPSPRTSKTSGLVTYSIKNCAFRALSINFCVYCSDLSCHHPLRTTVIRQGTRAPPRTHILSPHAPLPSHLWNTKNHNTITHHTKYMIARRHHHVCTIKSTAHNKGPPNTPPAFSLLSKLGFSRKMAATI